MPEAVDRAPINARREALLALLNAPLVPAGNEEAESHWAKYVCVLTAGYLETSVRHLLTEHATHRSPTSVTNYVATQLRRFQNPKMSDVMGLARAFSDDWGEALKAMADDERGDAVTSIVSNRHLIAHGDDSDVTLTQMRKWFGEANAVVDALADLCDA